MGFQGQLNGMGCAQRLGSSGGYGLPDKRNLQSVDGVPVKMSRCDGVIFCDDHTGSFAPFTGELLQDIREQRLARAEERSLVHQSAAEPARMSRTAVRRLGAGLGPGQVKRPSTFLI